VLVRRGGDRLLFDCGEGTQRQMQRSVGLIPVDSIFITHLHADHYLGVPGLLKTYDLNDRDRPLRIFGPPGLIELFSALRRVFGRIGYEVDVIELEPSESVEHGGYEIRSFEVEHRTRAYGYALVEESRPGRFDPSEAARLGVSPGPDFKRLQGGETVNGVSPDQVMGETRRGRKLVISGDTAPCEMTRIAAHDAQLLIHDASFADDEVERAAETGHSTGRQAARLAAEAGVDLLALVHVSSRYDIRAVLAEAKEEFEQTVAPRDFDLVEIPFPERGKPRVIDRAARARRAETAAAASASE
jgi:ribonuclease Z